MPLDDKNFGEELTKLYKLILDRVLCSSYVLGGAVVQRVRHLCLRSVGRGFESCPGQRCVTTLGKLFTPMCLCHQAV